nr:hypothetical protein Iba_chr01bCG2810 [Ipomoea batatas]GMC51052.1 hypothetical protein Iba_chr01cCG2610 [Ipomoea batatas]GMC52900.1 hypothetical protein Iba_chr01dCG1660 [Ipomoea batatas]
MALRDESIFKREKLFFIKIIPSSCCRQICLPCDDARAATPQLRSSEQRAVDLHCLPFRSASLFCYYVLVAGNTDGITAFRMDIKITILLPYRKFPK